MSEEKTSAIKDNCAKSNFRVCQCELAMKQQVDENMYEKVCSTRFFRQSAYFDTLKIRTEYTQLKANPDVFEE